MKVTVISFSGRGGGNCIAIARRIAEHHAGDMVSLYNFSALRIAPCGGCAAECFVRREDCPHFADSEFEICDSVVRSDLTYFVVPNHCDFPCANFFAFNERSLCYFSGHPELLDQYAAVPKKFVVVSNTGEANFHAALSQHTSGEPEILFLRANDYGLSSIEGNLMTSERAVEDLQRFIAGD